MTLVQYQLDWYSRVHVWILTCRFHRDPIFPQSRILWLRTLLTASSWTFAHQNISRNRHNPVSTLFYLKGTCQLDQSSSEIQDEYIKKLGFARYLHQNESKAK